VTPRRCLHVLPADLARGAQRYARALRDALDGPGFEHRVCTLFTAGEGAGLAPDIALDVPAGPLRAVGFDPRALARLRRLVTTWRPHVVVAHGGEPLKYAALARRPGARLVYYKIGTLAPADPARRALHRAAVGRADAVAAVSSAVAAEARDRLGVPADRLVVIPNGRDPADFGNPVPPHPAGEPPTLVFVGHLVASKHPERFVALVRDLRRDGMAVSARLVGDGPLAGRLQGPAAAAGVEMLGRRDDVPALLAASDLLVFPSDPAGEGMPGVLIEAALAGLPVVATDVPGAREVVADGETGLVVPVGDERALRAATARLAGDPALRARMGAAARARALGSLTLAASAARWAALLDELVRVPAGARG
jgi:glycosyltransferase involved in cell wall biosynthesis